MFSQETYESLANDMQWKVRRTLANSIHELAVILGPEVASQDLVPIFNGFIKDLDEVDFDPDKICLTTNNSKSGSHRCPQAPG